MQPKSYIPQPIVTMFKATILSSTVSVLMVQTAMAEVNTVNDDEPSVVLEAITVVADRDKATKATETTTTSQDIQEEHINTQQDLVRYNPEVSVAEVGRYGSKGFAMRGVDGNRVAMSYDGVSLPDQQINVFFSPYGYMYEGRLAPDTEMLSSVRIKAGSDSFASGSGAMGGAVNYKSKQPDDLIQGGKEIGGYAKIGYTNKNEEFMQAVGLAAEKGKFSAIINYAHREGHELKNHRMAGFNEDKLDSTYDFDADPNYKGKASVLPDALHYDGHATMGRVYYSPTDEHRFGLQGSYQYRLNRGNHYTKNILSNPRIGYDESELTSYGINYRYYPLESSWIDSVDADLSRHEVVGVADTYIYETGTYGGDSSKLERNEYRPLYDDTTQFSLDAEFLPLETDKLGTHKFSIAGNYAYKDHELIMRERNKLSNSGVPFIYEGFKFLGPSVKKDTYSLSIMDNIKISDKLDAEVGLRYDSHDFQPYMTDIDNYVIDSAPADTDDYPVVLARSGAFDKNKRMDNLGWLAGINYKLTPNWQLGYKASTGFMTPSISQMYSAFEIQRNVLRMNPNLKPEQSLNHELSLQGDFETFSVNATGFYTDYDDFINMKYYMGEDETITYYDPQIRRNRTVTIQGKNNAITENIDSAKTYGVRLGGIWDVSKLANTDGKLQVTASASYAKDSTSKGVSMLATQPPNGVVGIDYFAPDDSYQVHGKMRYLGAKKADSAKIEDDIGNGREIVPWRHIDKSKSAVVFDIYGSKKFDNGIKLSGGVYNVLDKKYAPWSNLRTLIAPQINSMVDRDGVGIARYTAPGRNFAVALTYEY